MVGARTVRNVALLLCGALLLAIALCCGCPKKEEPASSAGGVRPPGSTTSASGSGGRIVVADVIDDQTIASEGEKKASAVLSAHPDLAGFAGVNAVSGLGIAAALKNANKAGQVKVVAMDGDSGILDLIEEGVIDASIAQRQYWMSYLGLGYLYGLKRGVYRVPNGDGKDEEGEIPEVIDTTVVEVNAGNLEQFRTPSQGAKETMPAEFREVVEKAKAAGPPEPHEQYIFLGISTGAEYWRAAEAGLRDAAEALGVKAQFLGPTTQDAQEQADQMAQIIASKPAGILIAPGRPDTLTPYIDDAMEQGIPVICLDTDAPDSKRIAYFGTDNYNAGRKGAEILQRLIREAHPEDWAAGATFKVAISSRPGQWNLDERVRGYEEYFAEHAGEAGP